jgi:predicted aspartyl protease
MGRNGWIMIPLEQAEIPWPTAADQKHQGAGKNVVKSFVAKKLNGRKKTIARRFTEVGR